MILQTDWCKMLLSVLFAIRTSQHASTGFTPFCMLYNYDPVLPFEYADKLKHSITSDDDPDCKSNSDLDCVSGTTKSDPLLTKIQNIEDQCKEIFDKASKSIKKMLRKIKPKFTTTGKQKVNLLRSAKNV